jgi:translation initiation factor IF-2
MLKLGLEPASTSDVDLAYADTKVVEIRLYKVIYELIDDVRQAICS